MLPSDERIVAAIAIVLLYLAFCARVLWPHWRRNHAEQLQNLAASEILVAHASQTGFAEQIAQKTANSLQSAGMPVRLIPAAQLSPATLPEVKQALFIVSTTGEGDAPDRMSSFVRDVMQAAMTLPDLRYGVLALGDRKYRNFCAFGHRLDTWLRHQGATALFDVVEVDNGDEGALRNWQHQLSILSESPDLPDWETPSYERWRLVERRVLNPDSAGDPCFHVALQPCDGTNAQWSAGDIAEIDPHNSTWASTGTALPHREYSIASVPADGVIHLLIRAMKRPDGRPGLGSGWLTGEAVLGNEIALRIRTNSNFHLPGDGRPLILIGNGTGIAGLRALIKVRIAAGHHRNWLIFGERNAAKDFFYRDDIARWREQGHLEKLDAVFSRDQAQRLYVQHRLLECGPDIRAWVSAGASIYVCGSLNGMAPGVDAALMQILGTEEMERLAADGRYRRDVY